MISRLIATSSSRIATSSLSSPSATLPPPKRDYAPPRLYCERCLTAFDVCATTVFIRPGYTRFNVFDFSIASQQANPKNSGSAPFFSTFLVIGSGVHPGQITAVLRTYISSWYLLGSRPFTQAERSAHPPLLGILPLTALVNPCTLETWARICRARIPYARPAHVNFREPASECQRSHDVDLGTHQWEYFG
jgi:hypothetical protein